MTTDDDILLHTLGLQYADEPYRNHFVAGPGHADMPALLRLVEAGLMERTRTPGFLPDADETFRATDAGKQRALLLKAKERAARPRLTKAQERYRRFMDSDGLVGDGTFRDFLRHDATRQAP